MIPMTPVTTRAGLLGLVLVIAASLAFQLMLRGYPGDGRAVPPDTGGFQGGYLGVAVQIENALHGTGQLAGHTFRTPGYPLLFYVAGRSAGIQLSEVVLPTRNWEETNAQGRALVHRVILLQEFLGFLIPPLIYLIVLSIGGSVPLAGLASFAYFLDTRSVAFQYILMNETMAMMLVLLTLLLFLRALHSRTFVRLAVLGLSAGLMLLVRPPLIILVAVLCVTAVVMLRLEGARLNSIAGWLVQFLVIAALLPIGWSYVNYKNTGHFFYSMNATVTLQNFAARHFVKMEIDDPELRVLQRHAVRELERAAEQGLQDRETYAFWRTADEVALELGIDDPIHVQKLAGRANGMAIRNYPVQFFTGSAVRFAMAWLRPLENVKNRYALARLSEFGLPGRMLTYNGYMLFGLLTLPAFLVMVPLAAARLPVQPRIFFLSLAAFALLYSIGATMADENEPVRHAAQIRVIVNGMLIVACGILGRSAWDRFRQTG